MFESLDPLRHLTGERGPGPRTAENPGHPGAHRKRGAQGTRDEGGWADAPSEKLPAFGTRDASAIPLPGTAAQVVVGSTSTANGTDAAVAGHLFVQGLSATLVPSRVAAIPIGLRSEYARR